MYKTVAVQKSIDGFQRKLLRRMLNIKWEDKVTTEVLYKRTNQESWTTTIKRRRYNWYGHLFRLPEQTPVRQALAEAEKEVRKPRGGQTMTWLKQMKKDLVNMEITEYGATKYIAQERSLWKTLVTRAMSSHEDGKRH